MGQVGRAELRSARELTPIPAPGAVAVAIPASGAGVWLRQAYRDPTSAAHRRVLEIIVGVVAASMVVTALESDPGVQWLTPLFIAVEAAALLAFVADYAASVACARNPWAQAFGPWGLLNVLALLPSVSLLAHLPAGKLPALAHLLSALLSAPSLRLLRLLRLIRLLQLSRLVRRWESDNGTVVGVSVASDSGLTRVLKLELALLLFTIVSLAVVPDDSLRTMLLGAWSTGAVTVVLRFTLVERRHLTVSTVVLLAWLCGTFAWAHSSVGLYGSRSLLWISFLAMMMGFLSWLRIEAPADLEAISTRA